MEEKYRLRNNKTPYYFEKNIDNNHGLILKEFEVFDGNTVKWGLREFYDAFKNYNYYNTTPFFDNMIDEYGMDKKRILYNKNSKIVFKAKLNNHEVLGKINEPSIIKNDFVTIEYFGKEDVKISELDESKAFIKYKKDDLSKCILFDYESFSPCSNEFDAIYVDNSFLKSYLINDKIRVFVGKINPDSSVVKPQGYDVNMGKFITYPIDDDGKIIEEEMINYLENSSDLGIDKEYYKKLNKLNLISLLLKLKIDAFNVTRELELNNRVKVKRK